MFVVLDSSAIIKENYGLSLNADVLLSESRHLGYEVCIPSLVREEVRSHFQRTIQSHADRIKKSAARIASVTGEDASSIFPRIDVDRYLDRHSLLFLGSILGSGGQFLPYPPTSLESLSERAIARRRPFDEKGSGLRDALIWDTVVEMASKRADLVVLITDDRDFREGDNLHPHLLDDLKRKGIDTDRVLLLRELSDFIAEYVRPRLKEVELEDPLKHLAELGYNLNTVIPAQVERYYSGVEWSSEALDVPSEYETIYLGGIDDFTVLEVKSPQRILETEDKLLLSMDVALDCQFDVFVFKPDWYVIEDTTDLEIWDPDWNRHYLLAAAQIVLNCEIELVVDTSGSEDAGITVRVVAWKRASE